MKVLVADDERLVREEIAEFLVLSGCEVQTADDGRKALELAVAWAPHLVFLDVLMPEMEGIELTRELKRRQPGVRVVAMSGGGRIGWIEVLDIVKRHGADYTLAKPITHQKLHDAIASLFADPEKTAQTSTAPTGGES